MDSKIIFSYLHEHYLFKYLTDDELGQILPLFKPIELEKGDILYRTGFPGRNFFLIVSGKIILQDDNQNGLVIHEKGHFGEQALHKDGNRSKTAQALENSTLLAVNKRGFIAIITAYP
ncbi:MAG: cyclic nucleotide-binding domain-containing protein, partial [Anaerolineales bacterium]